MKQPDINPARLPSEKFYCFPEFMSYLFLPAMLLLACLSAQSLIFTPADYNFNHINKGELLKNSIIISNRTKKNIQLYVKPDCSCVLVQEKEIGLAPQGTAVCSWELDSTDEQGNIEKNIIFYSDQLSSPVYFRIYGEVQIKKNKVRLNGYLYLLLYNAMFILPLLAVFILFLLGMRSEHLAGFYRKKIKIVKIALGALFLCFVIILTYSDIKNLVISCRLPGKEKTDTEKNRLELLIFASSGCKDCAILKKRVLPGMAASSGINIKIQEFPIENRDNLLYFIRLEKIYGSPGKAEFPVIIAGSNIISGKTAEEFLPAIFNSFRQGIFSNIEHPAKNSAASEKKEISEDLVNKVKILPVAGAGLLDGINPCAFVTIIFLLSYLGLLKKKQGEIIATGLAFTAGVFITYYAFGLGLYKLLKYFSSVFIYISYIIKYTGALLALALAVFSFRDAAFAGRGQESEMTLQLPLAIKQKIHSAIRDNLKTRTVVFSSFILGLLVSFFELACTGQVYLPAIIMMIEN